MSTQQKFTPGPWVSVEGQGAHHRDRYIRAGQRKEDGTWPAVAKCCSTAIGARVVVEANAALIAAAPDLYAACAQVLKECYVSDNPDGGAVAEMSADVLDIVRAALAKARGEVSK